MHRPKTHHLSMPALAALWFAAVAGSAARAEVAWHPDLATALAASAASGKPVLAIFDASWGDTASAAIDGVISNPEAEAVVAACFEPVRLDVDAHPDEARELGIEHVPSACVLAADRRRVTSFEFPTTSADFVAAAARAAQMASSQPERPRLEETSKQAGDEIAAPDRWRAADVARHELSTKVRQLSRFAAGGPAPQAEPSRYALTAGSAFSDSAEQPATTYRLPTASATLDPTPPAWPAEPPIALGLAASPPAQPAPAAATLDPLPGPATPWLAASPAQAAAPQAVDTGTQALPAVPDAAAPPAAEKATNGFIAALRKPWSIFSFSSDTSKPGAQDPTMPPARPQAPDALAASTPVSEPDLHGPMPLGLEGYCPVTVLERGSWVEGRPQWGVRHRGRTYLFAGPEQQRAFLADPDRYAPALSGDDPVLAFEGGRSEPGRRAFGVTYQSRMYLFSSAETRAAFTAAPDRYTTRVMIAEGLPPADDTRRF